MLFASPITTGSGSSVCFVNDYQVRTVVQKGALVPLGLDVVDTDNKMAIVLVDTYISAGKSSLKSSNL